MNRYKKLLFVLIALLIHSCTSSLKQPSNKIEQYTLEYEPPQLPDLKDAEKLPVVLKVERFSVAPEYNTSRMIYRTSSYKRDAYNYHQWRAGPGDLVSYFLSRDMKQSGKFAGVLSPDSRSLYSYMLEGSVDEIFESDAQGAWKAVLIVSITLMVEDEPDITKKIAFQKTYNSQMESRRKNPKSLAEAMSQAMAKISGEIIRDIYDSLEGKDSKSPAD